MVEEERYCVDIINAVEAIVGALKKVENEILRGHLGACVKTAFKGSSEREKDEKIEEICDLFKSLKR